DGEDGAVAGTAEPGETLTYTLTVENTGGSAGTNDGLTDQVDPPRAAAESSSADPDFDGADLDTGRSTWTIASIAPGNTETRTVRRRLRVPRPDDVLSVRNSVVGDCVVTDTASCAPCDVTPRALRSFPTRRSSDLDGEDGAVAGTAEPGETLTYTLTVENTG